MFWLRLAADCGARQQTIRWVVCTQRKAGDGTPVVEDRPLVKGEPRGWWLDAPSFGAAAASGLTKPSTGRFWLCSARPLDFAKTPISGASILVGLRFARHLFPLF